MEQLEYSSSSFTKHSCSYTLKTLRLSCTLPPKHNILSSNSSWIPFHNHQLTNGDSSSLKHVLKDVTCEVKPGQLTAIAGPSGAGKTTLLQLMSGVGISCKKISGQILVNDNPMNPKIFPRISGYVTQFETLFPLLTVEECLTYSASLKLYGDLNHQKIKIRVHKLLKELKLEHVATTRIGDNDSCCNSRRGISGGEKRRVSIGIDLVHDPYVILIDEPTSGLDSSSALNLMLLLKSMAVTQGKTIVVCIHQPCFRILELLDHVVLLSNGNVVHHGTLDLLEKRLEFLGHSIRDNRVNILEFAMDFVDQVLATDFQERLEIVSGFSKVVTTEDLEKHHGTENENGEDVGYANSMFNEIMILGKRFCTNIFRTKQLFVVKMLQALIVGIVLGTIFMNASKGNNNRSKLQTRIGFFAFSLTFLLSSTTEGLPIFLKERKILMKETSRGSYRISSYVISNALVFTPFLFVVAILYAVPVYWLVGLRPGYVTFLYFLLVVWMVTLTSNAFVACFSALVPDFVVGTSIMAGVMGSYFLFSGYFISKGDMPWYWKFMHYMSLFKYPFECFLINEFGGENGGKNCIKFVAGECIMYGNDFLKYEGLKESQKWSNVWVMLGFIFLYRFVTYLVLSYRCYKMRG